MILQINCEKEKKISVVKITDYVATISELRFKTQ